MVTAFSSGPGDRGSIPGRVISKTQQMVLNASLLKLVTIVVGDPKAPFSIARSPGPLENTLTARPMSGIGDRSHG